MMKYYHKGMTHMYDNDVIAAMEAIDFQVDSKLAKRLTNIFQDVIDFRNELQYSSDDGDRMRVERIESVLNYFNKTTIPKFKDIVKQEVGFLVNRVISFGGEYTGVSLYFAVDLSFDNYLEAVETIERSTASGGSVQSRNREIVDAMKSMADGLDKKSGKMKTHTFGKGKHQVDVGVDIYFDVNGAFLAHDFFGHKVTDELTAKEIAAIMLHEIGHVISMCEHGGDMFATANRVNNLLPDIKNSADPVELINMMHNEVTPLIKKLGKHVFDDSGATKSFQKSIKGLESRMTALAGFVNGAYKEYESSDESYLGTAVYTVLNLLLIWAVYVVKEYIGCILLIFHYHIFDSMARLYFYTDTNATGGKASDIKANYNNTFVFERWADEFVSRHGYSAELASSLNKIYRYAEFMDLPQIQSARLRSSTIWNGVLWAYRFSTRWTIWYAGMDPIGYENQYQRARRMLRNSYAGFRSTNLPTGVYSKWIENTEACERAVNEAYVTVSNSDLSKALRNTLFNIINPVQWIQMVKDGKLTRDIEILDNRLDDMRNNELYYWSAKLGTRR